MCNFKVWERPTYDEMMRDRHIDTVTSCSPVRKSWIPFPGGLGNDTVYRDTKFLREESKDEGIGRDRVELHRCA